VQELQRTHRGFAAALQFVAVLGAGEQPLVLAQGVFDLGVAGQEASSWMPSRLAAFNLAWW
jgi:hypothetical protein